MLQRIAGAGARKPTSKLASGIGALVVASGALAGPADAEILWRMETSEPDGKTETTEIWANDENIRMKIAGEGEVGEVIMLGATDEMILIDHSSRTYFAMTASEVASKTAEASAMMKGAGAQMQAAMAEAMAGMSAEERAQMQAAMANMPGMASMAGMGAAPAAPKFEIRKTGKTENVLGANAVAYTVMRDGKPDGEIWAVKTGEIEGASTVRDRMQDLFEFMNTAIGDLMPASGGPLDFIDDLDGRVPVGGVDTGGAASTSRLVSAANISAPDGVWAPPADYRKQESPF